MRQLKIVAALGLFLASWPAFADSTINSLGAAGALGGTEAVPIFQGSNPAVKTTTGGIAALAVGSSFVNVKNPPNGATAALGDGQIIYDGAMAIGSSTLTTKQPLSTATESGTTVTLTFTNPVGSPAIGVPQGQVPPSPAGSNWKVGGQIVVAGVSVSGYNGTFTITAIPTSNTVQYTAGSGLSSGSGGTVYANSPFVAGDVGKLICVQWAGAGYEQLCGTISAYVDAQDVTLSVSNANGALVAPVNVIWGTSDQSAIAANYSTSVLPNGGTIYYPCGIYVMTAEVDVPLTGSWNIQGAASGEFSTQYSSFFINVGRPCAAMVWLTTSAPSGSSAIYVGNGLLPGSGIIAGSGNFQTQHFSMSDIALQGGAGWNTDGGGYGNNMIGLRLVGVNQTRLQNVSVQNFNSDCIQIETNWTGVLIEDSSLFKCAGWGVNTINGQGVVLLENYIQNMSAGGVKMSPSPITSGVNHAVGNALIGNTIQGNSNVDIRLSCGVVTGNYFDTGDTVFTMADSGQDAACVQYDGNYDNSGTEPLISFSVAGTALPSCSTYHFLAHLHPILVTDATACTNGTTYTGSGSTNCLVICDGTNWKETGAGSY